VLNPLFGLSINSDEDQLEGERFANSVTLREREKVVNGARKTILPKDQNSESMTHPLLPDLPGFSIHQIARTEGVITVLAHSQTPCDSCCILIIMVTILLTNWKRRRV